MQNNSTTDSLKVKLQIWLSGSAEGHNGMKSIISHLGTSEFPRLRVGIGKSNDETISHVLGKFMAEEAKVVSEVLDLAGDAVDLSLRDGVENAMNKFNNKSVAVEKKEVAELTVKKVED